MHLKKFWCYFFDSAVGFSSGWRQPGEDGVGRRERRRREGGALDGVGQARLHGRVDDVVDAAVVGIPHTVLGEDTLAVVVVQGKILVHQILQVVPVVELVEIQLHQLR